MQQYDSSLPWAPPWPQRVLTTAVWLPSLRFQSLYIHFSHVAAPRGVTGAPCAGRGHFLSLLAVALNFRALFHGLQLSLNKSPLLYTSFSPPPLSLHSFHPPLNSLWINTGNFHWPQPISDCVCGRVGVKNLSGSTHSINRFPRTDVLSSFLKRQEPHFICMLLVAEHHGLVMINSIESLILLYTFVVREFPQRISYFTLILFYTVCVPFLKQKTGRCALFVVI